MIKSGVDVNRAVTSRNARGGDTPNVVKVTLDYGAFGADGITAHPRPGGRYTRRTDVYNLRPLLRTEFNIEGYPSPEFIDLVLKVKPRQMTLIPGSPSQATSNSGWDTKADPEFLSEVLDQSNSAGIRTSVFIAADPEMAEYTAKVDADHVEPYAEPYTTAYPKNPGAAVALFVETVKTARKLSIDPNARHDLSLVSLNYFHKNIPRVDKVSIGHVLISDALYLGLEHTIQGYKNYLY